jgi:hypothetical protein
MKNKWILLGITGMALVFGVIFAGCDNGSTSAPAKYTVIFDGGDGGGEAPAAQTVESGQSVSMPGKGSLSAPAGKEFDGWRGDGQTLAVGDSYTVTKNVTFIAQWKTASATTPTFTSSANENTANNTATLGLVGTSISASPTGIVDANITTAGKIKITSVSAGTAVITVSTSAGMSATIAVTVAADGSISIGAIVPQSNPFIGVWIDTTWDETAEDWSRKTNYKFEPDLVYSTVSAATATSGDFTIGGTYEFNTDTKRLILRPQGQGAVSRQITYALDRSTLIFNDSEAYTKNPETGGGVNGSTTGTFAGIWKDVANVDVPMGFNGDGEYFEPLPQKSKDSKTWWFVVADYTYDAAHEELTIEHSEPKTYKVKLEMGGRQVKLTYPSTGVETTFEKQDF